MGEYFSLNPLREELLSNDEEYRYAYAEDFLNTYIATQIKVLRDQRNKMTQKELAEAIGTQQPGIARLENVNYSKWKVETLKKIARALGVRLKITFETFGTLLEEDADFSRGALERPSFDEDPEFHGLPTTAGPQVVLDANLVAEAVYKSIKDTLPLAMQEAALKAAESRSTPQVRASVNIPTNVQGDLSELWGDELSLDAPIPEAPMIDEYENITLG